MKKVSRRFIPIALILTALCLLVYWSVQFNMRSAANDPQVQMATDAAHALENGAISSTVVPGASVDIENNLAPYIIVYNKEGQLLAGNGILNGRTPIVPLGVLDVAKQEGENRLTWQPKAGVRSAIVVIPYGGDRPGFVLVGRSLTEVEKRESELFYMVGGTWLGLLILSSIYISIGL